MDPEFDRLQQALAPRIALEHRLGSGGMGTVWLAREIGVDRLVAVKTLRPDRYTADTAQRFAEEARNAARLFHPNVVRIHYNCPDGAAEPYFVMQYMEGETLRARRRRSRPRLALVSRGGVRRVARRPASGRRSGRCAGHAGPAAARRAEAGGRHRSGRHYGRVHHVAKGGRAVAGSGQRTRLDGPGPRIGATMPALITVRTLGPPSLTMDGELAPPELTWRKHLALRRAAEWSMTRRAPR
jgi:hypothetical protein